jgi:hypothetical protein
MSAKHRTRVAFFIKDRNSLSKEKIIYEGKVLELSEKGKKYLALDTPRKSESSTTSFPLETVLSIQEIFAPYIGKDIIISIEKKQGKIRQITILE